jgi:hypothetical protein
MTHFEETRRIQCQNDAGKRVVIIEQKKWPKFSSASKPREAMFDYITEDGEVANKLDEENFLLLMTDEVFHRA